MSELPAGHRIGVYEIRSLLGRGGMGEVYRAHDSRLRRDVAIKILPASFAADPDRLARFELEARALATLTHANIAAIYGVEANALVLELVDGETLAERLLHGALPENETIAIARQIAEGLEAAHEAGIVHRDLKPANIKITPGGVVKLLDFGIAKVAVAHDDETRAATEEGRVIGTTAYMSPEQARGRQVDKRTDVWSFGCVLFELLTGRQAFAKATPTDTLAAILVHDPDWSLVPAHAPAAVVALTRRCLTKDPRDRLRDIGEARWALTATTGRETAAVPDHVPGWLKPAAALAVLAMVAAAGAGYVLRSPSTVRSVPIRIEINPPAGAGFQIQATNIFFALSHAGDKIAYVSNGAVWIRPIGELKAARISGTDDAQSVFWSPDGGAVAYFTPTQLRKIDVASGVISTISDVPDGQRQHGNWGRAGRIVFASGENGVVFVVAESGGTPEPVVRVDRSRDEVRVHWPQYLPDGRRFLYVVMKKNGSRLAVAEPGVAPREIGDAASTLAWIDPDILLRARGGVLFGQRFDVERAALVGEPFEIADGVVQFPAITARALVAASPAGVIAYHSGFELSRLTWFDRTGRAVGTVAEPGDSESVRFSHDGTKVLFDRRGADNGRDLWIVDLARSTETRVTTDPGVEVTGVFLADDSGIVYAADRGGSPHLYKRDLASGGDVQLRPAGRQQQASDVSATGLLGFNERSETGNFEPFVMPLDDPAAARRLGPPTQFNSYDVRFSPDGRFFTYSSNRSGRTETYAGAIDRPAALQTMSSQGGFAARWSPDGREVYYLGPGPALMVVPVQISPTLVLGTPRKLFDIAGTGWPDYDAARDGRFLAMVRTQRANTQPLSVIVNWRPPGS